MGFVWLCRFRMLHHHQELADPHKRLALGRIYVLIYAWLAACGLPVSQSYKLDPVYAAKAKCNALISVGINLRLKYTEWI